MNDTLKSSQVSREAKWEQYLRSKDGENLLGCILKCNPGWKGAKNVASQIANIFQFNCMEYHSLPNEMRGDLEEGNRSGIMPNFYVDKLKTGFKVLDVSVCMARHIGYRVIMGTNLAGWAGQNEVENDEENDGPLDDVTQ
jgi:hypothetical protein